MPEPITPVLDPTIVSAQEPPVPTPPEDKIFPPTTPPVANDPAKAPTIVTTPDAQKPPETPTEPKPPTEPAKTEEKPSTPPSPTDYVLTPPKDSLLSQEDIASIEKEAKEAGLTKEQAEKIVNSRNDAVKGFATRQEQSLAKAREEWKAACEKDPIIGGEKFKENAEFARRGFNAVADLELKELAEKTGFGNHPSVVRAFAKLGRMMSEDKLIRGSVGASPAKKAPEDILYGNTSKSGQEPME